MKAHHLFIFILLLCVISCLPVTQEPITEVTLNVNDPVFQKLYDYQDKQQLDSLLAYTNDFDPSYRFMVANAMASIQSKEGLDSLYKLLYDPVMKVRSAAAYAIGQVGDRSSENELLTAFKTKDTLDVNNTYNAAILEAIGKLGNKRLLPALATVSTYRNTDSLLLVGQSRAIYHFGLRGITATEGTDRMVQYLTEEPGYPEEVRLIAANYLYRAPGLDLDSYKFRLLTQMEEDDNPYIRSVLAIALGNTKDNEILQGLIRHYDTESDYRVKVNIIRALTNFQYISVIESVLGLLSDGNLHIANTAADYLLAKGNPNDAAIYKDYITDDLHYSVKAKVYGAILKHLPIYYTNTRNKLKASIKELMEEATDPYEVAAYLSALGQDPISYSEVIDLSSESKHAVVRSTGASAIANIVRSPAFDKAFRSGQRKVKREIIDIIKSQIEKGDAGVSAIYGDLLSDEKSDLKPLIDDADFLEDAMRKLELPKEIETYNSLGKAWAYLTDKNFTTKTPDWNHPIDWSVFSTYGDSIQVAIKTNKGVIRLMMYAQYAPGSVANFVTLANNDFYDGKTIHRVVPNFVIQGGCPRGDGYGSLDYSIRSELPQLYYNDEGFLGMASAGLHTEGTQWFITHAPALHLDGNYTIFGKVISGMDVVHKNEVGDKIEDVIVSKL